MLGTYPHRRAIAFHGASAARSAPPVLSTGEASLREADTLRRRSADAYRNDPLLKNSVDILRRALLANPYPVLGDQDATAAFRTWGAECGHAHSYASFAAIQRMVAHHLVQDGECFVQRVWTRSDHSSNGLLLAVWPKRLVDRSRGHNWTGHEYADGAWAGTWFQSASVEPGNQHYAPVFVPRTDLIWVRYVFEGDQVEGVPRLHASLESAFQLEKWAHTALVREQVAACLSAVVIPNDSIFGTKFNAGTKITDQDGNEYSDLQPGSIVIAHNAKDVRTISPNNTGGGFNVENHTARVAAGAGLAAELVSGSMGSASFSALRHALLVLREVAMDLAIDFDVFRERCALWWREAEALHGRDWSHAKTEWLARPAPSVDPEKSARADQVEIELGIKSRRQAISERGRDPDEVFAEVDAERALGAAA